MIEKEPEEVSSSTLSSTRTLCPTELLVKHLGGVPNKVSHNNTDCKYLRVRLSGLEHVASVFVFIFRSWACFHSIFISMTRESQCFPGSEVAYVLRYRSELWADTITCRCSGQIGSGQPAYLEHPDRIWCQYFKLHVCVWKSAK